MHSIRVATRSLQTLKASLLRGCIFLHDTAQFPMRTDRALQGPYRPSGSHQKVTFPVRRISPSSRDQRYHLLTLP
jgi:hypothetical protein